jgi:hypothetical protein
MPYAESMLRSLAISCNASPSGARILADSAQNGHRHHSSNLTAKIFADVLNYRAGRGELGAIGPKDAAEGAIYQTFFGFFRSL